MAYVENNSLDWCCWLLFGDGDWGLLDPATGEVWNPDLAEALFGR